MSTELVLHNRVAMDQSLQSPRKWIVVTTVLLLMSMTVLVLWFIGSQSDKPFDWATFQERLLKGMRKNWFDVAEFALIALGIVLHVVYVNLARRRERLILNDLGIRYVSPLPSAIAFLRPSWSLQWNQVRRMRLTSGALRGPLLTKLELETSNATRSLMPLSWIDPATHKPSTLKEHWRLRATKTEEINADVMKSPLVKFVQKLPYPKLEMPTPGRAAFALEKNPAALGIVVLFFACITYGIVDMALGTETYTGEPFYAVYGTGGVIFSLVALWLLRQARVPVTESAVIAILAGAGFGYALYPGLLRVNQLTDAQGLTRYEYKMTRFGSFTPLQDGLPELDFPERHVEFWSSYKLGHIEAFELRKGRLDFYQINMAPLYERINEHYRQQNKGMKDK